MWVKPKHVTLLGIEVGIGEKLKLKVPLKVFPELKFGRYEQK